MRRALGKGLSQLIGEQADPTPNEAPIESIVPNKRQPRTHFDEDALSELSASIKSHGILQPLVVRAIGEGKYELIAGERRLRAAKAAGLKSVPIIVRSAGDQGSLELALIENVQREDISPLEAAKAYRKLMDEFGLTQEKVAEKVGKSRVAIANVVRLLKLQPKILEGLEKGLISEGHARALLQVENEAIQLALYDKIVSAGMTVRDVERAAKAAEEAGQAKKKSSKKNAGQMSFDPEWRRLEDGMSVYFGSPVKLAKAEVGGKITIDFYSDDDLTRILDILGIHL